MCARAAVRTSVRSAGAGAGAGCWRTLSCSWVHESAGGRRAGSGASGRVCGRHRSCMHARAGTTQARAASQHLPPHCAAAHPASWTCEAQRTGRQGSGRGQGQAQGDERGPPRHTHPPHEADVHAQAPVHAGAAQADEDAVGHAAPGGVLGRAIKAHLGGGARGELRAHGAACPPAAGGAGAAGGVLAPRMRGERAGGAARAGGCMAVAARAAHLVLRPAAQLLEHRIPVQLLTTAAGHRGRAGMRVRTRSAAPRART